MTQTEAVRPQSVLPNPRLDQGLILVVALLFAAIHLRYSYDDAYITYRYAYNLAAGQGFVYNAGERFLGTSAPLYGLLLGILGWFHPGSIPILSGFLSGLGLIFTGLALYRLGADSEKPLCGLLAALVFVANPMTLATFGGEMLFQMMLIAWAFVCCAQQKTVWTAVLLALAILVRPDALLAAGVVGAHLLWTRRRFPVREALILMAVLLPFALAAWAYYGSPLPATMGAKVAQTRSGSWGTFGRGTWNALILQLPRSRPVPGVIPMPGAWVFLAAVLLGVAVVWRYRFMWLSLAWAVVFALVYHLAHLPFYGWYIVPIVFALSLLAGCGFDGAVDLITRQLGTAKRGLAQGLVLLAVGLLTAIQIPNARFHAFVARTAPIPRLYTKTGRWLAQNTAPTASVGYLEIGFLGYYAHRRMIDPLGLINAGVTPHVAQGDFGWAYRHFRPDYIVENPHFDVMLMTRVMQSDWFRREYAPVATLTQPGVPPLTVYRRTMPPERAASD